MLLEKAEKVKIVEIIMMEGKGDSTALINSCNIQTIQEIVYLPQEVMEEIHLRLPVKSLLKCKCVSKSWLS